MKRRSTALTKEERDVLIAAWLHPGGRHLTNAEVAERLGLSVNKVKTLIHQAFVKLGAHNRGEAVISAIRRGEIRLDDTYSLDELAEISLLLGPDELRRLACLLRQQQDEFFPPQDEHALPTHRKPGAVLADREREVLILVGRGLSDREIAHALYLSPNSVRTILCHACSKLGTHRRYDALLLALRRGEISSGEVSTVDEMLRTFAPLGAKSVEKIAQLLDEKLGKEPATAIPPSRPGPQVSTKVE